ncbi:MAG: hypothetical protein N3F09_06580 [Bacteroidia bacterium]|nr:hypothetical protein [Bacteroidia bacterium]
MFVRKRILLTIILLALNTIKAQLKPGKSRQEILWAIVHPVCAWKVYKIYKKNQALYNRTYLKSFGISDSCDNKGDAFRHIFFMALFSQYCSPQKIFKLALAHEKKNYQCFLKKNCQENCPSDTLSIKMDIMNNITGIRLGLTFKTLSPEMIRSITIDLLKKQECALVYTLNGVRKLYIPTKIPVELLFKKNKLIFVGELKFR